MATASWNVLCRVISKVRNSIYDASNSQTESFVSDVVALAALKHVLLDVIADVEQLAAGRVSNDVTASGARNAFDNRTLSDAEQQGESEGGDELLEGHGCSDDTVG